jgi:hypothetical protein
LTTPVARAIPLFMVDENAAQLTHEEAHLLRQVYQALGKGGEEEEQDDEDLILTSCVFCRCRHGTFNRTVLSL